MARNNAVDLKVTQEQDVTDDKHFICVVLRGKRRPVQMLVLLNKAMWLVPDVNNVYRVEGDDEVKGKTAWLYFASHKVLYVFGARHNRCTFIIVFSFVRNLTFLRLFSTS